MVDKRPGGVRLYLIRYAWAQPGLELWSFQEHCRAKQHLCLPPFEPTGDLFMERSVATQLMFYGSIFGS